MTHRIKTEQRRVFILSATFLFLGVIFFACKKKETQLGSSAFDPSELLAAGAIDTFTINTYSIIEDSLDTRNPALNVLGEMNDPVFGTTKASFYTQIRLASTNPSFGDLSLISIDSMVLSMVYTDFCGTNSQQTFEVHKLVEDISADTAVKFYEFSTLGVDNALGDLVMPGKGTLTPDPYSKVVVDTSLVSPQLRLHLDTNLARDFMEEAASGTAFSSNDNFLSYFKGFRIQTNNASMASGKGAVYTLNMNSGASKLTIYYKKLELVGSVLTPVPKTYDFIINEKSQSFNHIDFNRSSKILNSNGNKISGAQEFYAQSFGLTSVLEIPGLANLPKTAVIHKAILDLPIVYQTGSTYTPGAFVKFTRRIDGDPKKSYDIITSGISNFTKSVNIDLRKYVQFIANGDIALTPIYISPLRKVTSMDRIIFNGKNTLNKVQPKLYIIYTEF